MTTTIENELNNLEKKKNIVDQLVDQSSLEEMPDEITLVSGITARRKPIIFYPNKILSKKCAEVKGISDELVQMIYDLFWTMKLNSGIGIAAPQIGELVRVIVIQITEPFVLINPVVIEKSGKININEGCLSMPTYFQNMTRSDNIKVAYLDIEGNANVISASGLQAAAIQHEIDHLDGKTLADALPLHKRLSLRFRWKNK